MSWIRKAPTCRIVGPLLLLAALLLGQPALAQDAPPTSEKNGEESTEELAEGDSQERYQRCMDLARHEPEKGLAAARLWQDESDAEPAAEHCAAEALIGLERYDEAARQLQQLSEHVPDSRKGQLFADEGWAWMMAEQPERAYDAQTEALSHQPDNVELYIDRSIALADMERYWESVDDLSRAHDLAPDRVDVLTLRASAYRRVDAPQLALDDVLRARELAPGDPGLKIQEGIMRVELGQATRAASLWQDVINSQPGTRAARIAEENLEQLGEESPPNEADTERE
ncbi:tetratricopeptide repeat protein [Fodinicurvata sediminis]|uniref:tetratricopeptide repeat protein n=1 Tax=Fodinicurvata sediminis TaxID=1121832 RepID=UPI0003B561A1|nr:hypothetical protein [Fodinicurvata sediminis]